MILREFSDALILDKPSGVATHTPDGGATEGFLEMASRLLDMQLWAVHRLDKETSGCLLVTTKASEVKGWGEKLEQGKKKYVFISPYESPKSVWPFEGRIEKTGNHRFELTQGAANSFTTFAKLGTTPLGYLYEAEITSGKTHQIRIHAQASGIPILGDKEHGGDDFFRLMLHAKHLELGGVITQSPLPKLFEAPKKEKTDIGKFLTSIDRRRFLMEHSKNETTAWRLVHREWSQGADPKLSIEKLGDVLQLLNYGKRQLHPKFAEQLAQIAGCKNWYLRQMNDRGDARNLKNSNLEKSREAPNSWTILENKIKYEIRLDQGLSSGLFLDQRENRNKVLKNSEGKRVANFFSYTCGFSVAAALGGAHEVVSVDTSSASLEWGKQNFTLNDLDPDKYEFFVADALFFLKSCVKRKRQFDLIIVDPPTFARHKHGIFSLTENLDELLSLSFQCLHKTGQLLFTTNDESLNSQFLGRRIESAVEQTVQKLVRIERIHPPYDFEFPLERTTVMKGYWVSL